MNYWWKRRLLFDCCFITPIVLFRNHTSCLTRRLQIPIWKLFVYFVLTTVIIFVLQMQRPQFSFEWTLTTVTTSVATTTVKPTTTVVPTTEEEVIRYVNISSYNNTRTLTHEYDIDFVRFVSGVNNGTFCNILRYRFTTKIHPQSCYELTLRTGSWQDWRNVLINRVKISLKQIKVNLQL